MTSAGQDRLFLDVGVAEDDIMSGGKALEKENQRRPDGGLSFLFIRIGISGVCDEAAGYEICGVRPAGGEAYAGDQRV